ncbi:hypothetical protein HPG69_016123, partial [Diceros bicornis minor]
STRLTINAPCQVTLECRDSILLALRALAGAQLSRRVVGGVTWRASANRPTDRTLRLGFKQTTVRRERPLGPRPPRLGLGPRETAGGGGGAESGGGANPLLQKWKRSPKRRRE